MNQLLYLVQYIISGFSIAILLLAMEHKTERNTSEKIGLYVYPLVFTCFMFIADSILVKIIATGLVIIFTIAYDAWLYKSTLSIALVKSLICYTLNIVSIIIASSLAYGILYFLQLDNNAILINSLVLIFSIAIVWVFYFIVIEFRVYKILKARYTRYAIDILSIIIILSTKGITKKYNIEKNSILVLLLFIIVISAIMSIIWLKDKREQLKREEEMQKSNSDLSGIVHKSRELIPALASKLKYLEDHAGESEEIAEELQNFRAEIEILSGEQAEEDRRNNMFMKTYEGSGFTVLDGMFQNRLAEAAKEDIDFDIIIRHPLNRLVREQNITQLALQRMIGDLISNAFRAVKKSERDDKSILFCAGYLTEDVYEIEIHDNADLFPIEILKHFGERGYTTGGTGNGIADILDTVDLADASFCLEEYPPDSSLFTKRIAVCFDRAHRMKIITERKEELGEMERFVVM